MTIMTEGNLDQMLTDLNRREAKLAAGWAQYTKERDNMKQEIQAELKTEFARLEALKVELSPKIAALQKAKEEATAEMEKLIPVKAEISKQQAVLDQSLNDLTARQAVFNEKESTYLAWHKEESRRLADENSIQEGKRIQNEEFQKQLDSRNLDESNRIRTLLSDAQAEKAKQVGKTAELDGLIESAKRKDLILTGQISIQSKALDERAKEADKKDQELRVKSEAIAEQEKGLSVREQSASDQESKNSEAKKSIETGNLHLQNRELKFAKEKKDILIQIENSNLSDELKGELKEKLKD